MKQGIQEFHRKYVLAPADKAANKIVVVCRLHYIKTIKQELNGTQAYEETSTNEKYVGYSHLNQISNKFAEDVEESQCIGYPSFIKKHIKLGSLQTLALAQLQNFQNY